MCIRDSSPSPPLFCSTLQGFEVFQQIRHRLGAGLELGHRGSLTANDLTNETGAGFMSGNAVETGAD
ncbi:hypothetical protein CKA32_007163 [Geitlerinema sp. FC II]|nr:hypothetical protein CKA32_007163 [Geitlerinema sp. FC II]